MSLRIALVMMQKNEGHLLGAWITYHRNLVDPASLFIFDNGSNDAHTLTILRAAEKTGIAINKAFSQPKDYYNRGIIFCELINQLDRDNPHDFYFPIDCDEFLAADLNGKLSCDREDIESALESLTESKKVLSIPHKYLNNPYSPNAYTKVSHCPKCFFAKDACESLVDGFHAGRTRWGPEQQESNITYFEFHYKPYSDHLRISLQKIIYLLPNHKRRTLANYIQTRQSNFHAAMALLQSEFSYLRSFETQARSLTDPNLLQRFADLGIDSTPLFDQRGTPGPLRRMKLRARHQLLQAGDHMATLTDQLRARARALKRVLGAFDRPLQ
ncbi:MAG: glycosyltransferase family 2 protein [Cyanobacteriota bacterium]|nr:glycosyltransferase family 2 protein [Cyanobacteriota bacterium]